MEKDNGLERGGALQAAEKCREAATEAEGGTKGRRLHLHVVADFMPHLGELDFK